MYSLYSLVLLETSTYLMAHVILALYSVHIIIN